MNTQRQNDDGSWSPAQPLGYQPGLDWEVYSPNAKRKGWRGELFDGAAQLATVRSRWRWLFERRRAKATRLWHRKLAGRSA